MSAESTLVFLGVRYEIPSEECESLENRTHPLIKLAKAHGLQHYFGNFAAPAERYLLFLGRKLGVIGFENLNEVVLQSEDFERMMSEAGERLKAAGIETAPRLFIQFEPDA